MDRCSRTCDAENILAALKSGNCKILKNSQAIKLETSRIAGQLSARNSNAQIRKLRAESS
jgi:hypothetical protein